MANPQPNRFLIVKAEVRPIHFCVNALLAPAHILHVSP